MDKIRVIVIDDHQLFRLGVCTALKEDNHIDVIAETQSGNSLLDILEQGIVPDVVLLDIIMPGLSGLETARILRAKYPDIKIIMLSSENTESIISECIKTGVNGFVSKLDATQELIRAVQSVHQGDSFYGKVICEIMYEVLVARRVIGSEKLPEYEKLFTERELEIISACAKGLSAKETAEKLFISKRTVDWHRDNIFKKLGINNTYELVLYAIKNGIVEL